MEALSIATLAAMFAAGCIFASVVVYSYGATAWHRINKRMSRKLRLWEGKVSQ